MQERQFELDFALPLRWTRVHLNGLERCMINTRL